MMISFLFSLVLTVQAQPPRCTNQIIQQYNRFLPNLCPHGPLDLELNQFEMTWSSELTNAGGGNFMFNDGYQEIEAPDGRILCYSPVTVPDEKFMVFRPDATFMTQSTKTVWCLMDSFGGSNNDPKFTGRTCGDNVMGISRGGTDHYGASEERQRVDTYGWPSGVYVIAVQVFVPDTIQTNDQDDFAFTVFRLTRQGNNPRGQVQILGNCDGCRANCVAELNQFFGQNGAQDGALNGYLSGGNRRG